MNVYLKKTRNHFCEYHTFFSTTTTTTTSSIRATTSSSSCLLLLLKNNLLNPLNLTTKRRITTSSKKISHHQKKSKPMDIKHNDNNNKDNPFKNNNANRKQAFAINKLSSYSFLPPYHHYSAVNHESSTIVTEIKKLLESSQYQEAIRLFLTLVSATRKHLAATYPDLKNPKRLQSFEELLTKKQNLILFDFSSTDHKSFLRGALMMNYESSLSRGVIVRLLRTIDNISKIKHITIDETSLHLKYTIYARLGWYDALKEAMERRADEIPVDSFSNQALLCQALAHKGDIEEATVFLSKLQHELEKKTHSSTTTRKLKLYFCFESLANAYSLKISSADRGETIELQKNLDQVYKECITHCKIPGKTSLAYILSETHAVVNLEDRQRISTYLESSGTAYINIHVIYMRTLLSLQKHTQLDQVYEYCVSKYKNNFYNPLIYNIMLKSYIQREKFDSIVDVMMGMSKQPFVSFTQLYSEAFDTLSSFLVKESNFSQMKKVIDKIMCEKHSQRPHPSTMFYLYWMASLGWKSKAVAKKYLPKRDFNQEISLIYSLHHHLDTTSNIPNPLVSKSKSLKTHIDYNSLESSNESLSRTALHLIRLFRFYCRLDKNVYPNQHIYSILLQIIALESSHTSSVMETVKTIYASGLVVHSNAFEQAMVLMGTRSHDLEACKRVIDVAKKLGAPLTCGMFDALFWSSFYQSNHSTQQSYDILSNSGLGSSSEESYRSVKSSSSSIPSKSHPSATHSPQTLMTTPYLKPITLHLLKSYAKDILHLNHKQLYQHTALVWSLYQLGLMSRTTTSSSSDTTTTAADGDGDAASSHSNKNISSHPQNHLPLTLSQMKKKMAVLKSGFKHLQTFL